VCIQFGISILNVSWFRSRQIYILYYGHGIGHIRRFMPFFERILVKVSPTILFERVVNDLSTFSTR
jgi:hypothetical protein